MHDVVMVGASHDVAALHTVGALAVRAGQLSTMLESLARAGCVEAAVLSTCSRTEIYAVLPDAGWADALLDVLLAPVDRDATELRERMSRRSGSEVEAHLFRVAAGLDSRIAGEVEIQGQVRSAARAAEDHGTMGPRLRALFGAAVATARRAHRETALATLGRSVGRTAVDTALEGLKADRPQVAVIGTGRMARVVVERLAELDIVPAVYGRSVERAERLSQRTAPARGIHEIPAALGLADVVISATSASSHLVTAIEVQLAMRTRAGRRLTVVDLSVPANVEPCTRAIAGVRLIDIDDLRDAPATPDRVELDAALDEAQAIVAEALRRFDAARHGRVVGPVIVQLQQTAEDAYRRSLRQHQPELVVDGTLDQVARALARRHVHKCICDVREAAQRDDVEAIERIIRSFTDSESPDLVSGVTR